MKKRPPSKVEPSLRDALGLACPRCGQSDALILETKVFSRMTVDSVTVVRQSELEFDTPCVCPQCSMRNAFMTFFVDDEDLK